MDGDSEFNIDTTESPLNNKANSSLPQSRHQPVVQRKQFAKH